MFTDSIFLLVYSIQCLLYILGLLFLLSGIDDVCIDISFLCSKLWERLDGNKPPIVSEKDLLFRAEEAIAVMIPAWDESDVIRPMLGNSLRTIAYSNYHVFVGTYPNDLETQREVDKVSIEFDNVHRVTCRNPGPTCKADCLNWVYQDIREFERENTVKFSIFAMEDCEDVVHPLCLKLINYHIPEADMVQLPVFPLERPWKDFTSGHYIDEFSEFHTKDVLVRQLLSRSIPAAGVGCAFSRRAFERLAAENDGELFNTGSLTEDYELGLKIGRLKFRPRFIGQYLPEIRTRPASWVPHGSPDRWIAVREYFPATFRTAYRQKARWVLGIAFQGWQNLGWQGGIAFRYMLYRDRKSIVTNYVSLLGYLVVIFMLALQTYTYVTPDAYRYPPVVERGTWLWNILLINLAFLCNRIAWRCASVYSVYGCKQAVLSIARLGWSNVINGAATNRALYLFMRSKVTGKRLAWDKTAHVMPAHLTVDRQRQRIGELLVERDLISAETATAAVSLQKELGLPIGFILVMQGHIREEALTPVLAQQQEREFYELDAGKIPRVLAKRASAADLIRWSAYPVREEPDGTILLAVSSLPSRAAQIEIQNGVGQPIRFCLTTRAALAVALRYAQMNFDDRWLANVDLRTYQRLGDVLLRQRTLRQEQLDEGVKAYFQVEPSRFGQFLVDRGYISGSDLSEALHYQSRSADIGRQEETAGVFT